MTEKPKIRIVGEKPFRTLHENLKPKVANFLREAMKEVFGADAFTKDYLLMCETVNPVVIFYINETGQKLFSVADKENALLDHILKSLEVSLKHLTSPGGEPISLEEFIYWRQAQRVHDDPRLKPWLKNSKQ
jgi:hypothetical protein